jgi:hypothetical protein
MGDTAPSAVSSLLPPRTPNNSRPGNEGSFQTALQQARQPQSLRTKPSQTEKHRTAAATTSAAPQTFWEALLEIDKNFATANVGRLAEQVSDPALKNILWTFQKLKSGGARGDTAAVTANLADLGVRIGEGRTSGALSAADAQSLRRIGDSTRPGGTLGQRNSTGGIIDGAVRNIRTYIMDGAQAGKLIADTMARPEVQSLPKNVKGELENALWDAYKTSSGLRASRFDDAKRDLATLERRINTLDGMVKRGELAPEALNRLKAFASEYRKEVQKLEGNPVTAAQQKANAPLYSQAQAVAVQLDALPASKQGGVQNALRARDDLKSALALADSDPNKRARVNAALEVANERIRALPPAEQKTMVAGASAATDVVLDALTKALDNHEGGPKALKEGLEGLKAALELNKKEGNVANVVDLGASAFKTIEGIMEMLGQGNIEGATEVAKLIGDVGKVVKLPSATIGIVDTAFKAFTGKDLSGKSLKTEERIMALWELPGQLKDIADFGEVVFQALAPVGTRSATAAAFEAFSTRLASVNPIVAGVTISYEEFKFLLENVYVPARRMLTDSLTAQYLGGDPAQLKRDVLAIQITPENAADVALRLQGLFENGGVPSMPDMKPGDNWRRFLSTNLSDGEEQTIKMINSAPNRNDPLILGLTQNYALKLQRLAVQFIDQEVRQANGG